MCIICIHLQPLAMGPWGHTGARMQCFSQSDRRNHRENSSLFGKRAFDMMQHWEELRKTRNDPERHLQHIEQMEDLENIRCLCFSSFAHIGKYGNLALTFEKWRKFGGNCFSTNDLNSRSQLIIATNHILTADLSR